AESADALVAARTVRDGLQRCAELLNRHIAASFVRIWTLDESEAVLRLEASAGLVTAIDDQFARLPLSEPLIGTIAREAEPFVCQDFVLSNRCGAPDVAQAWNLTSFVGYPLSIDHRVVGVMAAFASHPLNDAVVKAFAAVAGATAQFIDRK